MKKKRLLLVGIAPDLTTNAIHRAKKMGIEVLVAGTKEEIEKNGDLINHADQVLEANVLDYESLRELVYELNNLQKLDAIYTFREYTSESTAKIANELGLYGLPYEVVCHCNNKYETNVLLEQGGVLTAQYKLCKNLQEVKQFYEDISGAIVIKPLAKQGSLGVYKITSLEEVEEKFNQCVKDSKETVILAEEFIEGQEISLEVLIHNGEINIFGITQKLLFDGNFVEAGHITPYTTELFGKKEAEDVVRQIVKAMDISFGPMFIEGFITKNGFYIGEVHTRYGGDQITTITELSSQSDMTSPIFAELLGMDYIIPPKSTTKIASSRFISAPSGIISKISGIEKLSLIKGLYSFQLYCKEGDIVHELQWNRDRLGCMIAVADTKEELEAIFNKAFTVLNIKTN